MQTVRKNGLRIYRTFELKLKYLYLENSENDCLDMSYGKYEIEIIKNTTISCPNSIPKLNPNNGLIIDDLSKIKALK